MVVVANTPAGPWRTDVEKGSMGTAVDHGSVDPKGRDNSCSKSDGRCKRRASITRKGSGLIFPHPDTADLVHRSTPPCFRFSLFLRRRFFSGTFVVARGAKPRGVQAGPGERWTRGGDALALGDAGGGPGKSFLFLLRDELPGTESFGARDSVFPQSTAAPAVSEVPSPALENPRRVLRSPCRIVPISASGLQG